MWEKEFDGIVAGSQKKEVIKIVRKLVEEERKIKFDKHIFSESSKTEQQLKSQCADELEEIEFSDTWNSLTIIEYINIKDAIDNLIKKWRGK